MSTSVILLAGGRGTRMKSPVNKVLLQLRGKSIIRRSAEAFINLVDHMVIVCRAEDQNQIQAELNQIGFRAPLLYTEGGKTRQQSVFNGLKAFPFEKDDIILIHDGARCLADESLIARVIDSCMQYGSGIPSVPVTSTYKICDDKGYVIGTPDRTHLFEIQTPQGFLAKDISEVHERAAADGVEGTDDASLLEYYHFPVRTVRGSSSNIKITDPEDILRAEMILEGADKSMRIGMGYDVHQLVPDRKLILCGVEIPYHSGLYGHSDADVALHALMDAMFGACALGDIGRHFPDTDPLYKGISSLSLLSEADRIIREKGYHVDNLDVTIVAQRPRLSSYIPQMVHNIARTLSISPDRINVKATTTEKLGFEGRGEGISAYAVCIVKQIDLLEQN